jgi:[acyl-carrier-protein] S-malonyltransferase
MSYLLSQKVDLFVEIGPGNVLSKLMKRIDKHARTASISNTGTLTNYLLKGFELWHYKAR